MSRAARAAGTARRGGITGAALARRRRACVSSDKKLTRSRRWRDISSPSGEHGTATVRAVSTCFAQRRRNLSSTWLTAMFKTLNGPSVVVKLTVPPWLQVAECSIAAERLLCCSRPNVGGEASTSSPFQLKHRSSIHVFDMCIPSFAPISTNVPASPLRGSCRSSGSSSMASAELTAARESAHRLSFSRSPPPLPQPYPSLGATRSTESRARMA